MTLRKFTPRIVYSDDHILAMDKPAGMPSISLKDDEKGTLSAWLIDQFPEQGNVGPNHLEAGLVHRLDNDTSGLMIAARTRSSYDRLRRQFSDGSAGKFYLALVLGITPAHGGISTMIAHHPRKKKMMMVCETREKAAKYKARPAKTVFNAIGYYVFKGSKYSLLSISIATGVRHQIRVHMASIGHPIAGDGLYQNARMRRSDVLNMDRHFLHSYRVVISHPKTDTPLDLKCPLPADLRSILWKMRAA